MASYRVDETVIDQELEPSWNVAPTDQAYGVLDRKDKDGGPARRELRALKWGLVPFWAKDSKIGSRMINARGETLAEKPAYRRAAALRRLAVPSEGYFEWKSIEEPDGTKYKQAYYLRRADEKPMTFAGLYELWFGESEDDPLWSYTIITTVATATNDEGEIVHDRTPFVLPDDKIDGWLDTSMADATAAQNYLRELPPVEIAVREVGPAVGNVGNNDASLIEPMAFARPERQALLVASTGWR